MSKSDKNNQAKTLLLRYGYVPVALLAIGMTVAEFRIGRIDSSIQTLLGWFQVILLTALALGVVMVYLIFSAKSIPKKVLYTFCLLVCVGVGFLSYVNVWFFN